jgi:hypothetical protein
LGALCLLMCFFLRRTAARAPAPISRLPQADLQSLLDQAPEAPSAPAPRPVPPAPQNPSARVVNALRDVLLRGLVVPTEFDDRHRRSPR